jgi:hypothetical protein
MSLSATRRGCHERSLATKVPISRITRDVVLGRCHLYSFCVYQGLFARLSPSGVLTGN